MQPALVSCCGKHFCENCLMKWQREKGKTCPHCRSTEVMYMINKERVRDINELQVYCSNKTKGCKWVGELGNLNEHIESTCQSVEVDCPKKCKLKILRGKLNDHLKETCLCRDYSCMHCGKKGTYHTITGECGEFGPCRVHKKGHYSECDYFPIKCPNKCSATVARGELTKHRISCPLERVECSFLEVGCKEELVRKDLDNHIATNDHHHLLLMMKAFKELQTKMVTLIKEQVQKEIQPQNKEAETFAEETSPAYPFYSFHKTCCFDLKHIKRRRRRPSRSTVSNSI